MITKTNPLPAFPDPVKLRRRVKLRDLDTLIEVVRVGGIHKAAETLNLSQPAVSKAIAQLEETFGVPLLERSPKGVTPTPYGRALIRHGGAIFDQLRQGVNEIGYLADPSGGDLCVGCGESLMASLAPVLIDRMHRQRPRLKFSMETGDSPLLVNHFLRERICELVLLRPWADLTDPDLHFESLFHERIFAVAGTGSPWARRRKVRLEELLDQPWILSHNEIRHGSPTRAAFDAVGAGLPSKLILSGSLNLRHALLATGRYLTVVPETVVKFCGPNSGYKVLPVDLPRWEIATMIVTLAHRNLSPLAEMFMQCTREVAAGLDR